MPLTLSGDIAGLGKVVQIVRATDSTRRTTASTSFVDANISVTITPQKSDSAIILIWTHNKYQGTSNYAITQITDSSNNAISGAEQDEFGPAPSQASVTLIAYATPATTSAVTYKGRFRVSGGSVAIYNDLHTGQMYAIEVAA